MKLLVQPEDGISSLLKAINKAAHSVRIVIFRFDQKEVEQALRNAVARGVSVHALIAHTNRAGEESLRKLELRLLAAGVTVARTADDLMRYHGKFMVIDGRELYLLAFNWTYMDIERSRSFGVITGNRAPLREAERVFEADTKRHPYEPGKSNLVVSPVNARKALADFIKGAKKELIVYDPKVSDPAMLDLIADRSRAGVNIRVIGRVTRKIPGVGVRKSAPFRLHTRTMVRDGTLAFLGSQSLRAEELDARREVGIIFRDPKAVGRMIQTFEKDWAAAEQTAQAVEQEAPASEVARRVAKAVTKSLPDLAPVLNGAVKEVVGGTVEVDLSPQQVASTVKDAVKKAVKEAVSTMVQEVVEEGAR